MATKTAILCALIGALASFPAHADDRAVLIGVGIYPDLGRRVSGIEIDLELMRRNLERLGLSDEQMVILENEQATRARIQAAIQGWLPLELDDSDRVFIYYSGLGATLTDNSGDEEDGLDEALVPYDARWTDGKLTNAIIDDELMALIERIPSQNVYLLIDAAHSGSEDYVVPLQNGRLGVGQAERKLLPTTQAPHRDVFVAEKEAAPNSISLVAGDAVGSSLATEQGSVFTLGLTRAIEQAYVAQNAVTLEWLKSRADSFVGMHLDSDLAFRATATGNMNLLQAIHPVASSGSGQGPVWRKYISLVAQAHVLTMTGTASKLGLQEELTLDLALPADGYLNIITIDADDQATVLFPNKYHQDNRVERGNMHLPTEQMGFAILAQPPTGPTLVVALLTTTPINAYHLTALGRNSEGEIIDVFAPLSERVTRGFVAVGRETRSTEAQGRPEMPTRAAMHAAALQIEILPGTTRAANTIRSDLLLVSLGE